MISKIVFKISEIVLKIFKILKISDIVKISDIIEISRILIY